MEEDPKQAETWGMGKLKLDFHRAAEGSHCRWKAENLKPQSSDLRERKWPCGLTEGPMGSYGGETHDSVSPDSTVRTRKS